MAVIALTNSSSPVTVERATADDDPYERETQLNGLALNFDAHDHTSAKGLGVGRVQTSAAPAASGQVRANGDAWQWWGATAGAVRTAVDVEGTQTVSGAKTFTSSVVASVGPGVEAFRAAFAEGPGASIAMKYNAVGAGYTSISSLNGGLTLAGAGGTVGPAADNTYSSGAGPLRWTAVYAVAGAINTSTVDAKMDIALLDPAACVEAVKTTDWVSFAYLPPPPPVAVEPQAGEPAADSQARVAAQQAGYLRMLQETAPARRQRGYVLGSDQYHTAELFGLADRASASPGSDVGTLGAALQAIIARVEALESAAG